MEAGFKLVSPTCVGAHVPAARPRLHRTTHLIMKNLLILPYFPEKGAYLQCVFTTHGPYVQ